MDRLFPVVDFSFFDQDIGVWTLPRNLIEFYMEYGIRSKTYEAGTQMTDHVRILLIDDDEEDFLIVSDMLAEIARFSLDWVPVI